MAKQRRGRNVNGILVLDKPAGESSNRSLQRVKRLFNASKAGHTGSLDPLATGVLPLCFGEATKISQFLLDADKRYSTTIKLGIKTASGDSQSEVLKTSEVNLDKKQVEDSLEMFRGEIRQIPSMYSALKHKGVPLYKLARKGEEVERKERVVTVYSLNLLDFRGDEIDLEVHCSKGTYIRMIADDLGDQLGVGGHVTVLRRLQSGPFTLAQSVTMEQLEAAAQGTDPGILDQYLIEADFAVEHLEKVDLPTITADFVRQGQAVIARGLPTSGTVRLYDNGQFIGIGKILDDGRVAPVRLIKTD
ncbi:tRNA pseudouridine(55) synthase TruB [Gammaproteobacteria bacterium]|nr:tRNA pseudouridine(55) synthase TruB [Gammaproteobacteria bacterium]